MIPVSRRRGFSATARALARLNLFFMAPIRSILMSSPHCFAWKPERRDFLRTGGTAKRTIAAFWAATAIEYGLIAAGINLAIIAAVSGLGSTLQSKFTTINTSLKQATVVDPDNFRTPGGRFSPFSAENRRTRSHLRGRVFALQLLFQREVRGPPA